jgi:predicted nucleotidyltransferase
VLGHNSIMADWLSSTEFARARGLTPQRVRQLLAAGKVPGARRIGERWAIPGDAAILRVPAGRPVGTYRLSLAAAACLKALRAAKVNALVTGSAASGATHAGSDLDLLVLAHPGRSWAQVEEIAYAAAAPFGVPVDVVFIETLPPAVRTVMLRQAHAGPAR